MTSPERDDHQQPVALGDVVRVPRRGRLALGHERAAELEGDQHDEHRDSSRRRERRRWRATTQPTWAMPIVAMYERAAGARSGSWRETCHHRKTSADAHDHVARHHHAVVERAAAIDRREHLLQPERQHDDADHLHHRRQAEDPVVGVVGRREPRVVQPRPAHGERGEREPDDAGADVVLGDVVGQLVGGRAEGDDDGQVVEQLQRRRGAVLSSGSRPLKRRRRWARSSLPGNAMAADSD